MSVDHPLDDLFNPESIAVIGATERDDSVGKKIMSNLIASNYAGGLYPINPKHETVLGKKCYATINDVKEKIDLAVIVTPAATVPAIMKCCGEKNIHSAIIISAGFSEMNDAGKTLEAEIVAIAKQYNIRFLGPNCLGMMRPSVNLNATFDNNNALPGSIALVSQSGAICAAILDWAISKEIGFSTIVSMGNSVDLDFGDMLDYLAEDENTKSILLYIEGVHFAERFLNGLRKASRKKPVIAIKAGRQSSGVRAVHSHTGALVGDDDVFSAVLKRAGCIRVDHIEQLFTAAEVLSSQYVTNGNRLTIVSNGGGAGVMAADAAADLGVDLPQLTDATLQALNKILPAEWSHQNPIDIIGDATAKRYRDAIEICLQDETSDALLVILVPLAMSEPLEVATEISALKAKTKKPIITCWMGAAQAITSRQLFAEHQIPCYRTPEVAVEAFSYLADYYQNQKLLAQVVAPIVTTKDDDVAAAKKIIAVALSQNRTILSTTESKDILNAFNISVAKAIVATTADDAAIAAEKLTFPIVMKINSPDITHKQDVGGVQLNIQTKDEVKTAFNDMMASVKKNKPDAKLNGVTIEHMYQNANYRELMIGIIHDKVFGPVMTFGMGGSLVEVIKDRAVALPPLNEFLAHRMIAATRAAKILAEFRGKPAVNMQALIAVLLRVSALITVLPEVQEMDINPLLLDEKDAVVVDARFVIAAPKGV